MEKIPEQFMHELRIAVQESDGLKRSNVILTKKNVALQIAFEKLMERYQEYRAKMGFDNDANELTYHLFDEAGVLDLEE